MKYENPYCPYCFTKLITTNKEKAQPNDVGQYWTTWTGKCPKCQYSYKWNVQYATEESTEPEWIPYTRN